MGGSHEGTGPVMCAGLYCKGSVTFVFLSFRRWQDGARFEEFMARHAEESRDDLQAMKALNVFYQVRFMLCFSVLFSSL